jgi:glutaminase
MEQLIMKAPLQQFLEKCYDDMVHDLSGNVADYIPELSKCDPDRFGISLATLDGHVYDIGDCDLPFTIQSISKAFVFALALERLGSDHVESVISVEPSGEAFNAIRLTADNRPFNPMVNAGAIACSGLIVTKEGRNAFNNIHETLSRFAGRELGIDEAVYQSESLTGDRNRAIAWLLRNYSRLPQDVDNVLDVYFKQCSILVTAHDLAIMAATLANNGVNPITGDKIISPYVVARTLSVMTSSGMYDYAGQWLYKVGMPAKSGVGGGIIASLPATLGLGTYSPRLDGYGNSIRGIGVCERISSYFNLHVLSRKDDVEACILADYDIAGISSRRSRRPPEIKILQDHHDEVRIIELVGALTFSTMDYVSRKIISNSDNVKYIILDIRRVPGISLAAEKLLGFVKEEIESNGIKIIFSGAKIESESYGKINFDDTSDTRFVLLDEAIEWAENDILLRYTGKSAINEIVPLNEQLLLRDFSAQEISALEEACVERVYKSGDQIISTGSPAESFYFLQAGKISVKFRNGVRLSSLSAGMSFGEMALLESIRSADIWADTDVKCLELTLSAYNNFRKSYPESGEKLMRNGAFLLSQRLRMANTKVDILSSSR